MFNLHVAGYLSLVVYLILTGVSQFKAWVSNIVKPEWMAPINFGKKAPLFLMVLICFLVNSVFAKTNIEPRPIHIVFDLDWTLIYATRTNKENVADVVFSPEESYRFTDGAAEIIEYLASLPDVKISFFSGGPAARNQQILQKLFLPSGKSAWDLAYKVLSKDELDARPGVSETSHFSLRYRKNLKKISGDYKNIMMFEDSPQFIDFFQLDNVLWLGNPFEYVDRPELVSDPDFRKNLIYLPDNLLEWRQERSKLVWGFGVILKLIENVKNGEALDMQDAYRKLFGKSVDAYSKPNPGTKEFAGFLEEGNNKLAARYPKFKLLKSSVKNIEKSPNEFIFNADTISQINCEEIKL